jgi:hypothetical protein
MPATIDTALLASDLACDALRADIAAYAAINKITHLITSRVLDPLGVVNMREADMGQLEAILHCLFIIAAAQC